MEDKQKLIDILNSQADENPNYTVWTVLKYHWNSEKGFRGSLEKYVTGRYMSINTHGNYVPYSLMRSNYLDL